MVRDRRSARGITLIEALVVLAILSIAMAVAIPNFRAYSVKSKLLTPVRDVEHVLAMARLQAVNAQRPAVVAFMKSTANWDEWPTEVFTGKDSIVAFQDNDGNSAFGTGDRVLDAYVLPTSVKYRRPGGAEPLPTARIAYGAGGGLAVGANAEVYFGDDLSNFVRIVLSGAGGHVRRQMYDPAGAGKWLSRDDEGKWPWRY